MAKYIITWLEKHMTETEAKNMEEAQEKALTLDGEHTIVNIYGTTVTRK